MSFLGKKEFETMMMIQRRREKALEARGVKHVEAFCLMQYLDEVTADVEVLWNARDGVTPFTITSKAGNSATHVRWEEDQFAPNHVPSIGDRVFVDLTEEHARALRIQYVEEYWDSGEYKLCDRYSTKEEAVEELVAADMLQKGRPCVLVVDEDFLAELSVRRGKAWAAQNTEGASTEWKEVLAFMKSLELTPEIVLEALINLQEHPTYDVKCVECQERREFPAHAQVGPVVCPECLGKIKGMKHAREKVEEFQELNDILCKEVADLEEKIDEVKQGVHVVCQKCRVPFNPQDEVMQRGSIVLCRSCNVG